MKQKRNGEREFEKPSSGLQEQRGAGAEHVKSAETSAVTPGPISRAVRIHEVPTIPYQSAAAWFGDHAVPYTLTIFPTVYRIHLNSRRWTNARCL